MVARLHVGKWTPRIMDPVDRDDGGETNVPNRQDAWPIVYFVGPGSTFRLAFFNAASKSALVNEI